MSAAAQVLPASVDSIVPSGVTMYHQFSSHPATRAEIRIAIGIAAALTQCGLTASNSDAFRKIQEGGVRIDGEKIDDRALKLPAGFAGVLQVGKLKFCKARVV